MNNERIESLFFGYAGTDEYENSQDRQNLSEEQRRIDRKIKKLIDKESMIIITDLIADTESISEQYGFVMGVKYAMQLMRECFTPMQNNA